MSNGEFDITDLLPIYHDEYTIDGQDVIDQHRLRAIEGSKKNTQAGIKEYTAFVLFVDNNTPDSFLLTDLYGKALQIFGGVDTPMGPSGPVGKAIAYIVGPGNKNLPHDHLTPPCVLPSENVKNIDQLDEETRKVFLQLWYPCSFMIPQGLKDEVTVGSTVKVTFSKGPEYDSYKGGMITEVLNSSKNFEAALIFAKKCKGQSIAGPAGAFLGGPTLTSGKAILQDAGYYLITAGGYPGPCRNCQPGCNVEVSLDVSRISNYVPKRALGNDPRALFAMLVDPFLPSGTVLTSGLRSPQNQQNILIKEVNRMKGLSSFTSAEREELATAVKAAEAFRAADGSATPSRDLYNTYNKIRLKYKGRVKILLIGPPRVGSGHQNPGNFSLSFAVDYSGVRLDCIIEALNLAGPIIAPYTPITKVIREGANNAVHVEFKVTDSGRSLSKLAAADPDAAAEKIKAILQQADEKLQESKEEPEEIPDTSEESDPGLATNVSQQITNTKKQGA